ncbi:unnamed protein product [Closterium sp. Naga37s-1]|nr:unnamed protein product [Closterium sp. Naga37s-1]
MQQLREDFPGMLAAAMRNALNGAPNLGSSPAPAAPAPAPAPVNAQVPAAPLAAPAPHASAYPRAPAPGSDRAPPAYVRPVSASQYPPLPWIPPLPDTGFVGAGGGGARGAFVPPRRFAEAPSVQPPPPLPVPPAALRTGVAQVPTATLAQLWRLVECQQALTLILVNAHFAILQSPGSTLGREARGDCLAAAAQLAFLLLPLLGAPAMGGVAHSPCITMPPRLICCSGGRDGSHMPTTTTHPPPSHPLFSPPLPSALSSLLPFSNLSSPFSSYPFPSPATSALLPCMRGGEGGEIGAAGVGSAAGDGGSRGDSGNGGDAGAAGTAGDPDDLPAASGDPCAGNGADAKRADGKPSLLLQPAPEERGANPLSPERH